MLAKEVMEKYLLFTEEEKKNSRNYNINQKSEFVTAFDENKAVKNLFDAGKIMSLEKIPRFVIHSANLYSHAEIIYMCKGNSVHIVNGVKLVLTEGELLFLGVGTYYETLALGTDDIAVKFNILPQFFDKVLPILGEGETPLRRFLTDSLGGNKSRVSYLHYKVSKALPIQNIMENLLWTNKEEMAYRNNINQITMGLLFLHLMNYSDQVETQNNDETAIIRVLKYIENNYKTASLTEISKSLHYDMFFLSKEIKRITGKTYKQLLQEKRLMQAAYLLSNTILSVDEVAENVGYSNISYFHKIFQKKFEMTPRTYRVTRTKKTVD